METRHRQIRSIDVHLFGRISSRREEANAGSQMAFPKSCSLASDIRVLRDMGMVGQSRARLPLQRPQRALHVDLFRYEGCFGPSQYLRHASLPSSCFVRVSYNKWWLRCGERGRGGKRPLVSWCLVPFSRALIIRIDRAPFAGKNLLKFCCHWLVRFPSSLSLSLFFFARNRARPATTRCLVVSLSAGSKDANDRRLIYSCVIFTSLSIAIVVVRGFAVRGPVPSSTRRPSRVRRMQKTSERTIQR